MEESSISHIFRASGGVWNIVVYSVQASKAGESVRMMIEE